jgi:hypothetical protein
MRIGPPTGRLGRVWRRWWRSWLFCGAQLLFGVGALAYLFVALIALVTLVFAPGRYIGWVVFPLGRTMASLALRLAGWLREDRPPAQLPPVARTGNVSATLMALVRSNTTWRAYGWLALSIPALILNLAAVVVFFLAPLWARPWAALTVRLLGRPSKRERGRRLPEAATPPADSRAPEPDNPPRRGYGLTFMRERVAAVGGSIQVGPTADGGFAIRAVLPVGAADEEPDPTSADAADDWPADLEPTSPTTPTTEGDA